MPKSMTGYGAAKREGTRVAVDAEIRTVNARSLKIVFRAPPLLAPREPDLERMVRARIRRGTVTVFLRLELVRPGDAVRIRLEVVEGLASALDPLRRKGLIEGKLTADALAAIPGALEEGTNDPLRPADWKVVKGAVEEALDALDRMRQREAAHLVKDLKATLRALEGTRKEIERRAPRAVAAQQRRLQERVDALLESRGLALDEATLAREVALLADKADINEETTRLAAHLEEFGNYLGRDGEVGRILDFLCQELLREANTIGSKSSDLAMARAVIALKSGIDRLKEQAANLE